MTDVVKNITDLMNYSPKEGFINFIVQVILALLIYIIGSRLISWFCKFLKRHLFRFGTDDAAKSFLLSFIKISLQVILILSIAGKFGIDKTSIAAVVGSAGVAVSLSLQGGLSNFIGGLLLMFLRPFSVGDYIIEDTNGKEGTVKEIQIFYTKLSTIDNKTIVIPNGMLTNNSITNATAKDERQLDLRVGISYNADIKKAKSVIEKLLSEDASILKEEQMNVFVNDLADSAVVLGIRAWVKNEEYWATRWRLLEEIKVELDENGIEIPYPQVTVHMKEDK